MSGWMINIDLQVDSVLALFDELGDAAPFPVLGGAGWKFGKESFVRVYDADPDDGTDVLIDDWTEKLGWRIYDFLAERTTVNLWMMDDDAMLLTARGLTPQDVGLDLAVDRVPSPVRIYDDQGGYEEWHPEPNPRAGTLT
ncbi:MAG: hypothetical protein L0H96_08515 [Humibacillus sp.]|nr:hypothetical protein [Humibacillus sp.]MDN5776938.1 hypothetical protein [Humibacillus sp.]